MYSIVLECFSQACIDWMGICIRCGNPFASVDGAVVKNSRLAGATSSLEMQPEDVTPFVRSTRTGHVRLITKGRLQVAPPLNMLRHCVSEDQFNDTLTESHHYRGDSCQTTDLGYRSPVASSPPSSQQTLSQSKVLGCDEECGSWVPMPQTYRSHHVG
jgi:hypothetical protein